MMTAVNWLSPRDLIETFATVGLILVVFVESGLIPVPLPGDSILFLAGDHDLSTPLEWARQEAARAPRGKLVVVPGAGHSVQTRARNLSGRRAVEAFLLR